MKSKGMSVLVLVVAFVVVAGGSFWLGTYYQQWSRTNQMRQFIAGGGQGQPPGMSDGQFPGTSGNNQQGTSGNNQQGMPGGQPNGEMGISGKVDKVDSNIITITTPMGSQKIEVSSDAKVSKPASGSLDDIKKGVQIFVQGKRDSNGKMQVDALQIISE